MKTSLSRITILALAVFFMSGLVEQGWGQDVHSSSFFQLGDFNLDGAVNLQDGPAEALALANTPAYLAAHNLSSVQLLGIGDLNFDGNFNNQDINAFLRYVNPTQTAAVAQSQTAMLYFSSSATNPGATSPTATAATNPSITITQGTSTTLYIWAQMNDLQAINGLSLGVHSTQGAVVSATASTILNPTSGSGPTAFSRWSAVNGGTLGAAGSNELLSGVNAVFVSGNFFGLDGGKFMSSNGVYVSHGAGADGSGESTVGSLLVGSITLEGNSLGTTSLFFNAGNETISYEDGFGGPNIQFGAGDAPLSGLSGPAITSALADATVAVVAVPEPASICLAGIAAFGMLLARSRRHKE